MRRCPRAFHQSRRWQGHNGSLHRLLLLTVADGSSRSGLLADEPPGWRVARNLTLASDFYPSGSNCFWPLIESREQNMAKRSAKRSTKRRTKRRTRRYSPSAGADVENEMHRYKRGTARSGPGGKAGRVKSRKQAV